MTEPMLMTVEGRSRVAEADRASARDRASGVKSPTTLTLITRSHAFHGKVSNGSPQLGAGVVDQDMQDVGAPAGLGGERGDAGFAGDRAAEALARAQARESSCAACFAGLRLARGDQHPRPGAQAAPRRRSGRVRSPRRSPAPCGPGRKKARMASNMAPSRRSRFAKDHSNSAARAKLRRAENRGARRAYWLEGKCRWLKRRRFALSSWSGACARAPSTRRSPALCPRSRPKACRSTPLGSVGDFPLYNHDVQLKGFPPVVTAMADGDREGGRRRSS